MIFFLLSLQFLAIASPSIELLNPESIQRQAVDALRYGQTSPYQILEKYHAKGHRPRAKDFSELMHGRCFYADRPNQAVPSLLAYFESVNGGPAFSGRRKIIPLISKESEPSFFDRLSGETSADIANLLRVHDGDFFFPTMTKSSVRSIAPRSMDLQARSYNIRKAGKYIVMQTVCEDFGGCFSNREADRRLFDEGETVAFCYYFPKSD